MVVLFSSFKQSETEPEGGQEPQHGNVPTLKERRENGTLDDQIETISERHGDRISERHGDRISERLDNSISLDNNISKPRR